MQTYSVEISAGMAAASGPCTGVRASMKDDAFAAETTWQPTWAALTSDDFEQHDHGDQSLAGSGASHMACAVHLQVLAPQQVRHGGWA